LTRHTNTAFFRRLLHHRVCTRVACASRSLTASRSFFLSHGIENGQLLQYGHAYQLSVCANVKTMDARVHTRGMARKWKRYHIKRIIQRNGTLTFYWPLLYVSATFMWMCIIHTPCLGNRHKSKIHDSTMVCIYMYIHLHVFLTLCRTGARTCMNAHLHVHVDVGVRSCMQVLVPEP
jgi:hypothetical protein